MGDDRVDDVDAAVRAKALLEQVFERIAPTYGSELDLFDVFGRDLVTAAAIGPGDRVLDLACGRGACLRPASEAVGARGHVLGIDLSPTMVELTSEDLRREKIANASVEVGDAEHLALADESVDVVTCGFGNFLFPRRLALLESRRVLRGGGRFAASSFAEGGGVLDYPWLADVVAEVGMAAAAQGMRSNAVMAAGVSRMLLESGFEGVSTTATEHRFVFADVDAYLRWVRSQALGPLVSGLPEQDAERFRQGCAQRLEDHRVDDGFELVKRVELTVARRP